MIGLVIKRSAARNKIATNAPMKALTNAVNAIMSDSSISSTSGLHTQVYVLLPSPTTPHPRRLGAVVLRLVPSCPPFKPVDRDDREHEQHSKYDEWNAEDE